MCGQEEGSLRGGGGRRSSAGTHRPLLPAFFSCPNTCRRTRAWVPVESGAPFFLRKPDENRRSIQPDMIEKIKTPLHFRRLSREENADINKPGRSALGPGSSRSTSDFLSGYSCVHTVQGSAYGNALMTWGVSSGRIDRQRDSWGLSDMSPLIW